MPDFFTFDERSMRLLIEDHRKLRGQVDNIQRTLGARGRPGHSGYVVRTGITATNTAHPTYPTQPADTFVVRFSDWTFTETPGEQQITRTQWGNYDDATVIARDPDGCYWPEGMHVEIERVGPRWWIRNDRPLLGKLTATLAKGASGTMQIWTGAGAAAVNSGKTISVYNSFASITISSGAKWVGAIPHYETATWHVFEREC